MIKKIKILIVGRNPQVAEVLLRLVNKNESWEGILAMSNTEAIQLFSENDFDIILLSSGIPDLEEDSLRKEFGKRPDIIIIQHYGGGSGLLSNEILSALEKKKSS
ncbi:MAG: hypothetical protein NVSMB45_01790 [Ginsengibacter sp.]